MTDTEQRLCLLDLTFSKASITRMHLLKYKKKQETLDL